MTMYILEKMSAVTFTASIFLLLPFFAYAAGIDDIVNYKSPPTQVESKSVDPYTIQDIISKLPSLLDDNGVYKKDFRETWVDFKDPMAVALDEEKFGKCDAFYIRDDVSYGGIIFNATLKYLFPENEEKKVRARSDIKRAMEYIEDPSNLRYGDKRCADRDKYIANLKELLNAVIQAAPTILQNKQYMVEIALAEKIKKQNQEKEKARAKQQSEEKAKADRQAIELAETKSRGERLRKLEICQNTNEFKLYEASATIESNQMIAKNAQLAMQREEDGAKISGYVNKQVMYEMGNRIAGVSRLNKENFEIYKKLGGSARNVESVKSLPNPCSM